MGTEKAFAKIQYPFMMITLKKLGVKRNFLNQIQGIYDKLKSNIILKDETLKTFPLRSGKGETLIPRSAIRQENKIKYVQIKKKK